MSLKRDIVHAKAIIDGKLYDTEKAEAVTVFTDNSNNFTTLFQTKNGNYFLAVSGYRKYLDDMLFIHEEYGYHSIQAVTQVEAKRIVGLHEPDKYIELFGEVEEA